VSPARADAVPDIFWWKVLGGIFPFLKLLEFANAIPEKPSVAKMKGSIRNSPPAQNIRRIAGANNQAADRVCCLVSMRCL
jgi:hypothetical protein